jgi:hypothetical protein
LSFWQRESYDHRVRDAQEFLRIKAYIERNPVKAGIVNCAAEYRWSSAWSAPELGSEASGGVLASRTAASGAIPAGAGGEGEDT